MSQNAKLRRVWTKEEDQILQNSVDTYHDGKVINWHAVALSIPGWNNKDCRKRWVYSLDPSKTKGRWAEEEDALLLEGVEKHGLKWADISRVVESRQPDQCSRRWHECLKSNINHGRWSLREDQMLKEAVQVHGRKWTEIVERYFPERTPITAKRRYQACFEKPSGQGLTDTAYDEAENVQSPDESTTLVEDSTDAFLKQEPRLLQHVRDYTQRPLRQVIVPADAFENAHGPSIHCLGSMTSSRRNSVCEASDLASMSNNSTCHCSMRNGESNPAYQDPLQPHSTHTTVLHNCGHRRDSLAVRTALNNVRGLDPWDLSSVAPIPHSGTPFNQNETSDMESASCGQYYPAPKGLLSQVSYVLSSLDESEVPLIDREKNCLAPRCQCSNVAKALPRWYT